MGRYASRCGVKAAAAHFSRKFKVKVQPSTIQYIKKDYLGRVQEKRKADDGADIEELPEKKRGRHLLLGEHMDSMVQAYLKKLREGGGVVSRRIAMAAARGIVLSYDKFKLAEFGGHIEITKGWANALLHRMKFVQRKASTAKSKLSVTNFAQLKKNFLEDVVSTVDLEEIPPELILNWDQTGINIVPASSWTLERQGSKRVEITGVGDKRMITAVFCGSLTGDFLPIQIVYKGKTNRCHPHFKFPANWHITHSEKRWSNEETMIQYIESIIIPYIKSQRELLEDDKPAIVIMDNFKGQITPAIHALNLEENCIHVCLLATTQYD